jgi:hypothetical protein
MKPTLSSRPTLVMLTLALINVVGLSATAFAAQALWVADAFKGTVVEFLSAQVAAGGNHNQTPHLTNPSAITSSSSRPPRSSWAFRPTVPPTSFSETLSSMDRLG